MCAPWWKDWPTPRAVIFDLDNCLASAGEIGQEMCAPAFAAIRKDHAIHHIKSLAELKHFIVTPAD
jgi:hypothetical protein